MRRSWTILLQIMFWGSILPLHGQGTVQFTGSEYLGRPTDNSIVVNVVANTALQAYFEYGTSSGNYTMQTSTVSASANDPLEAVMDGLTVDTRYYYRMVYSQNGGSTWTTRDEHTFQTQRPQGATYKFTITSDSHINVGGLGNISQWRQALDRIALDNPDLHLDLGDTFQMDGVTTAAQADANYLFQRAVDMMGKISHSTPIFLALGNHENEEGWNFDDTNPQPIFGINARKRYFPNPIPDSFYSGNSDVSETRIIEDHLREDYYAWEWGDVLFIVLDPFQYTMNNPYGAFAGESSDDPASGDRWNWTLGQAQYNWFKQTVENSDAKYKFIFAHHQLGGTENYVRQGAVPAPWFEWGGNTVNSSNQNETWEFNTKRPGMSKPIHQLMIDNNVSAFFHGHDHQFVYEKRDGIVYQEVPSPSMGTGNGFNLYTNSPYVQPGGNLPNSGYLRVTVSSTNALVEYISTSSGNVTYSYSIAPNGGGTGNTPPSAVAAATPTSGTAPLAVAFTGNNSSDSDGTIVNYVWTFGDGSTASTANPNHTYSSAGNYTAVLTVTDNEGATDSDQISITVTNPGGQNQPPVPVISSPQPGQNFAAGATISFSGSASDPEDGTLGASTAVWRVSGPGIPANYVLASGTFSGSGRAPSTGTYSITLQVQDSQGLSATATRSFTVGGTPNTPPTAVAVANPTSGNAPLIVNFTGSNSSDSDGSISSYAWNFGDGSTATTANPSHTYSSAGNYTASLTVTDNNGATNSAQVVIAVTSPPNESPVAILSATPTSGEAPLPVSFTGSNSSDSDGTIVTHAWYFGDGITANTADASHTYANAGNYSASLIVTDNQGAMDTANVQITVTQPGNNPPTAVVSATPTSGEVPLSVNFTGSNSSDSDGSIASYSWNFGDGTSSNTANPSHTYTSAGNFSAILTVTDDDGATDVAQVGITANAPQNQPPTAVASANPTSGMIPLLVNFTGSNSTDIDGNITGYSWNFGDGGTANDANPSHTYNSAGSYTATLTVTDDEGATDAAQVSITVSEPANTPPVATITQPANNANFSVGQVANYAGSATDTEDGTVPASRFLWYYSRNGGPEVQFASGQTSGSIVAAASGSYAVILQVQDSDGETDRDQVTITIGGSGKNVAFGQELVNLNENELHAAVPEGIALQAIYPNPFNPDTHVMFSISKTENVYLEIYDTVGRLIRTLINGEVMNAGPYRYYWDGHDNSGQILSSGVYIFRLRTATAVSSKKAILLK